MKNNGGPAFPQASDDFVTLSDGTRTYKSKSQYGLMGAPGMSLRDYFAIHADQMDLSVPVTVDECAKLLGIKPEEYRNELHYPEVAARCRYAFADAMLKERSRE